MGISRVLQNKIEALNSTDKDRLVRMGWEDRTTFEAIEFQFGLSENEFVRFMRSQLSKNDFKRWRKRVHNQGSLKHQKQRGFVLGRFKCKRQSCDGITKGWK